MKQVTDTISEVGFALFQGGAPATFVTGEGRESRDTAGGSSPGGKTPLSSSHQVTDGLDNARHWVAAPTKGILVIETGGENEPH